MKLESTKAAAESVLRELPSVIGASVREDAYGHPREIHLLVRAGPNPRHLAYDVRELLEERLGIPIDQRVISIAQLAAGKRPGPLLAGIADPDRAAEDRAADAAVGPDAAAPAQRPTAAPGPAQDVPDPPEARDPRVLFTGMTTDSFENRVRIRISLTLDGVEHTGEASGLDTTPARLRACAGATLQAVDRTCVGRARFEVEHVAVVHAFEREYVLVTALVSSPFLGRRPIPLAAAHPVDLDAESAVALAALKAINRTLSLVLRLGGPDETPRSRGRYS